jgi:hypothetical protein
MAWKSSAIILRSGTMYAAEAGMSESGGGTEVEWKGVTPTIKILASS